MLFFPNFKEEGPGIPPDAPRKKGFARFAELLGRDGLDLFRAGFLALLGCLPFLGGVIYVCAAHSMALAPLLGLAGGILAGPELCGLADTCLRAMRDEPGFWWHLYRRAWRRNAIASLLPGAAGGLLLGTDIFLFFHAQALGMSGAVSSVLLAGTLLLLGLAVYVWPQIALTDLRFLQVLRSSALLFAAQLPRSLGALAVLGGYIFIMVWFFPIADLLLPLTNLWLPAVWALLIVYPGLEEHFPVEGEQS